MKKEDDFTTYDDVEAVKFIQKNLPQELKEKLNEDIINYVLDVIYDYYEEKGLIEEDSALEASIDEEDMLKYALKAVKKDKIEIEQDEVQLILDGEYEYGKSLGIYVEQDEE